MSSSASSSAPPPPNGQVLSLVSALSSPHNHALHVQAIQARDEALSCSPASYGNLCLQLAFLMIAADRPAELIWSRLSAEDLQAWKQRDAAAVEHLQQQPAQWIQFGQMAGLVLKNALLRPPILPNGRSLSLPQQAQQTEQLKDSLLYALQHLQHPELRAVASSIIATSAVSVDGVQPALHIQSWPQLVPQLLSLLMTDSSSNNSCAAQGALQTIQKIMEDGPSELAPQHWDDLVPALLHFLQPQHPESCQIPALQALVACLDEGFMPSSLVLHFDAYLSSLSALATATTPAVRQWVCRSIVTLLDARTEYLHPHILPVAQFMLQCTADRTHELVALEACEFWFTLSSLGDGDDGALLTQDLLYATANLLPQLVPILLADMVYSPEQQAELLAQNEIDWQQQQHESTTNTATVAMRPVFHKSRAQKPGDRGGSHINRGDSDSNVNSSDNDDDVDDDDEDAGYSQDDEKDDNDDEFGSEDGNAWTLRKCAAASLDSMAGLYGAKLVLPCLLPALEQGLCSTDPWIQEASVLALGAVADGCMEEMSVHMGPLHSYLMNHLAAPEGGAPSSSPTLSLPQLKSIAAWTIGRYASWAVEQVQSGAQGHLLAHMTEVFLARLQDRNRRVQVACLSAFGVVIESAGDLMTPYLQPIYEQLVAALSRYQGRSLLLVFDVLGIMADCCGPAIADGDLPSIYIPPILHMWDRTAQRNPADRALLPLMECLAAIAVTSGTNFQPYALQSFESAMCIIEMVTLELSTTDDDDNKVSTAATKENEEVYDPIICATDLLDGIVEGMGHNFLGLVNSSQRYGQHFLSVLHSMCGHLIAGVRMSALALLGDLARKAPAILESAIPQLLSEAVANIDPIQPSVCTNAVWAVGEICLRCQGNPSLVEPIAPTLIQNLLGLLAGNGVNGDRGSAIHGLAENAAACVGRLAKVNPNLVAPDFARLLQGWCDGMAKIVDPTERRDAFEGFLQVVYVNPNAIQQATANVADAIVCILYAILTWHVPAESGRYVPSTFLLLQGDYNFRPFPATEAELGKALAQLMVDMKTAVGDETWFSVQKALPVNVRRLLREAYQL